MQNKWEQGKAIVQLGDLHSLLKNELDRDTLIEQSAVAETTLIEHS